VAEQGLGTDGNAKEQPATQDVPVIFYSFLTEQAVVRLLSMDYLLKPLAGAELEKPWSGTGYPVAVLESRALSGG